MSARVLVDRYIADLEQEARILPPARAAELTDEVREHIATALGRSGFDDEASVRNVLDRLGAPAEIVSAEEGGDVDPRAAAAALRPGTVDLRPGTAEHGPLVVFRRLVLAGLIGLLAVLLVGLAVTQGPGAILFAIVAAAASPVVWLALIAAGASRDRARSASTGAASRTVGARRRLSPALVGLAAVLVVLAGLGVVAGPMMFATVAPLMVPVLVLLLVVEVLRGR